MDRAIKSPNRVLFEKWGQHNRMKHIQRLENIRHSVIGRELPNTTKHMKNQVRLGKLLGEGSKKQRNLQDRHE